MKSLEKRFIKTNAKNVYLSSIVCFAVAITQQHFSKDTIHRWFQKLVDKDDYSRSDKRQILEQLDQI